MPRTYKPKPGRKVYKTYDETIIQQALMELEKPNTSLKIVAEKYKISKSVLHRHKTKCLKPLGGQTALTNDTEEYIVENLNICADWGYPLDTTDLRYIVKMYLDTAQISIKKFKNNFPGPDFVEGFLKRNHGKISTRICQNIKRSRAAVSPDTLKKYFGELEKSLQDVPTANIINYDETNLTDDPGRKKVIVRRGCKYPERVLNHSKGSVSIMMAGTAEGDLLPPYVVYKSTHLYDSWVKNGPAGTRYNRTGSGWFDGASFTDWVKNIVIPYFEDKEGKKILIGDNLASHLSLEVIKMCKEKNIHFVFLPANSTHITQPLDVAFFRPTKVAWRQILDQWKKTDGRVLTCVPKGCFPRLLKLLIDKISINSKANIQAGFRKAGIVPLDINAVLTRLPTEKENPEVIKDAVDESFLKLLKEMRYGTINITEPKKKRQLDVIAGRSVSEEEVNSQTSETAAGKPKSNKKAISSASKIMTSGKGKGTGKKTIKKNVSQNTSGNEKYESVGLDMSNPCKQGESEVLVDGGNNENENINIIITKKVFKEQQNNTNRVKCINIEDTENEIFFKTVVTKAEMVHTQKIKKDLDEENNVTTNKENRHKRTMDEINDYLIIENDMNLVDINSMPIIFSDDVDSGLQEVCISTEKQGTVEERINTDSKREKIKIISDITLPPLSLPLPKKSQLLPKSTTKPLPKRRRLSKNYYDDEEEILKILEDN